MASAFTHAYSVLPLTALFSATPARGKIVAGLIAVSILPDLDVLAFLIGVPYEHPLGHRGFTHSLPFAAGVGCVAVLALRNTTLSSPRDRIRVFVAFALASASHGVLDAMTDAGLGIGFLIPFSGERFFFGWRPIKTSPLDPAAFLSGRGLEIMANEIVWIWIPVTIVLVVVTMRRRRRTGKEHR